MDIGGDLRRARTARNLSLADISRRTKISPSVLHAIETNQFESVPSGLFTRGFLRAYAREVELDPDLIVQSYRSAFEARQAPADAETTPESAEPQPNVVALIDQPGGTRQTIGLAVVVLIGFAYVGFLSGAATPSRARGPIPTDAINVSAAAIAPVATSGALDTARETFADAPLKIDIQASGPCWVAASADHEGIAGRLLNAGERQQFVVRDELTIRVGDPSAFTFTIDGVPGKSLGPAATPVNAQITRQNYKTFLARGKPSSSDVRSIGEQAR